MPFWRACSNRRRNAIGELLSGKYPLLLWRLGNYGESLIDIADYVLPDGNWNVMHQHDETIEKLYKPIINGTKDQSVKAQQDINRHIIGQAWFAPMAYPDGFYAHNPKINVRPASDLNGLNPQLWDFQ
ncbi:hypothetical protein GCM10010191_21920 [Actinomadura vinacea]|uniref:Solute-binding protein family 5 domain-containing protein n=1 Tax=Actinomadura vinacea TaxID=115336 RepID=A0ABP5VVC7_9ACTN